MNSELSELLKHLDELLGLIDSPTPRSMLCRSDIWIIDTDVDQRFAPLLARSLAFHGLRTVQLACINDLCSLSMHFQRNALPLIISVSSGREHMHHELEVDTWCSKRSIPWIRLAISPSDKWVDIGPLFVTGITPCYNCFRRFHLIPSTAHASSEAHYLLVAFWCNVLAPHLIHLCKECEESNIPDGFRRYSMLTLRHEYLRRSFLPSCSCRSYSLGNIPCDDVLVQQHGATAKSLVYEDYTCREHPSRTAIALDNVAVRTFVKNSLHLLEYPHSRVVALAVPSPLNNTSVPDLLKAGRPPVRAPLTTSDLSALLMYSVGLRFIARSRDDARRWAASAGNLGSPELFIAAKDVVDLEPGIYRYRPLSHDLVHLEFHKMDWVDDALNGCASGELLVFFIGAYYRLHDKYGPFAYKLLQLDSGVTYSQASMVASSLGKSLMLSECIDDLEITKELNLSYMREFLTTVARLSSVGAVHPLHEKKSSVSRADGILTLIDDIRYLSVTDLTNSLYLESMQCTAVSRPPIQGAVMDRRLTRDVPYKPFVPSSLQGLSLEETLLRRRSVREFIQDEAPPHSAITEAVGLAYVADSLDWPTEHAEGRDLHFYMLEQGGGRLLKFDPDDRSFKLVSLVPRTGVVPPLYVDACFEKAPIAVWIVGDLSQAVIRSGSRGHRQLLFRAGSAANRMWLTIISIGLEGAISAGLLPRVARSVLGFDGWKRLALCAFFVGMGRRHNENAVAV